MAAPGFDPAIPGQLFLPAIVHQSTISDQIRADHIRVRGRFGCQKLLSGATFRTIAINSLMPVGQCLLQKCSAGDRRHLAILDNRIIR